MKSRKLIFTGLIVVAVTAAVVAFRVWPENRGAQGASSRPGTAVTKQKGPGAGGNAPLAVYVHEVKSRPLAEQVTATGTLVADEAIDLVSELSAKAVLVAFTEGSQVKAGDLLVKLDDTELRVELSRAESRIRLARLQAERQGALIETGGTTRENLDLASSEVRVREAEMALVQAQLAKTEIRAPFDGVIGLRYLSPGAFVTPATRIATLQKIDRLKVEFAIAERHLERVRNEAEVMITIAGLSEAFAGKVYALEPRIDPATRTLRLRARAENPGGRALPGGFATVEMNLRTIPDALLVPATALVAGLNEQRVFVVVNGRAEPRTVQIGLRLAREVQIISGLEPTATVITSGQLQLRPGMAVRPVPSPGQAAARPADAAVSMVQPQPQALAGAVAP